MPSKVVLISTGGTIAMRKDEKGGQSPALSGKDLLACAPEAEEAAEVEVVEFGNIPSFHVTPKIMLKLATEAEKHLGREDVAGVIITHGTDVMEEIAYFLDLWVDSEKPVCLTGAMRGSGDPGADGPANIVSAVRAAVLPTLRGYGVMVVMNDEIHAARLVRKMHKSAVETFASPDWGPLGRLDPKGITVRWPALPRENLRGSLPLKNVPILKFYSGMDSRLPECLLQPAAPETGPDMNGLGMDGLVLEGLGIGNVSGDMVPVIKKILDKVPVVLTSGVPTGRVSAEYSAEGGGKELESMGVILSGELNSRKARIKLMLGLGVTNDRNTLDKIFNDNNRVIDRQDEE